VAEAGDGRVSPFFGSPVPIEADDALVIYPPEAGRIARLVAGPCPRAKISTLRKKSCAVRPKPGLVVVKLVQIRRTYDGSRSGWKIARRLCCDASSLTTCEADHDRCSG
jgi:hypothetical protein